MVAAPGAPISTNHRTGIGAPGFGAVGPLPPNRAGRCTLSLHYDRLRYRRPDTVGKHAYALQLYHRCMMQMAGYRGLVSGDAKLQSHRIALYLESGTRRRIALYLASGTPHD